MIVSGSDLRADAHNLARQFGSQASTPIDDAPADLNVNAVFISRQRDGHDELAIRALGAQKNVGFEKPVGLTVAEADAVATDLDRAAPEG